MCRATRNSVDNEEDIPTLLRSTGAYLRNTTCPNSTWQQRSRCSSSASVAVSRWRSFLGRASEPGCKRRTSSTSHKRTAFSGLGVGTTQRVQVRNQRVPLVDTQVAVRRHPDAVRFHTDTWTRIDQVVLQPACRAARTHAIEARSVGRAVAEDLVTRAATLLPVDSLALPGR